MATRTVYLVDRLFDFYKTTQAMPGQIRVHPEFWVALEAENSHTPHSMCQITPDGRKRFQGILIHFDDKIHSCELDSKAAMEY